MPFKYSVSLDKIKFKGKFQKYKKHKDDYNLVKIRSWCEKCSDIYDVIAYPECFKEFRYRYSYTLTVKGEREGAFYVGEWYNGEIKEQREKPDLFVIEYNPNKSGVVIFRDFCDNFIFKITEICYCDLAYDVPDVDIKSVLLDTTCDIMTYGKTHNATYYIAPKEDQSGRVKIYQKDKERKSVGEEKEKTLRIEISLKGKLLKCNLITDLDREVLEKCVNRLNSVKIAVSAAESEDWKIFALSKLSPEDFQKCLGMMASQARRKYKNLSFGTRYDTLGIDIPTFVGDLSKVLSPYNRWRKGVVTNDLAKDNRYM